MTYRAAQGWAGWLLVNHTHPRFGVCDGRVPALARDFGGVFVDALTLWGSVSRITGSVVQVCTCLVLPRLEKPSLGLVFTESQLHWLVG